MVVDFRYSLRLFIEFSCILKLNFNVLLYFYTLISFDLLNFLDKYNFCLRLTRQSSDRL